MNINDNQSRSIGDNDTFVSLIKRATEDKEIKETITTILNLPTGQRKIVIYKLIEHMKKEAAPTDFIAAIGALIDDDIANKVGEVLKI